MSRVPQSAGVVKALRGVRTAAQKSLKGLNQLASQKMARGDYGAAEALAARGKEIRQFQLEVDALRKRWREVCGPGSTTKKKPRTPLWGFYQPILQALVQLGGAGTRAEVETQVERVMSSSLQAGDLEVRPNGVPRWRLSVRFSRKPLVQEGWIVARNARRWEVTDAGRKAAEKGVGKSGAGRK